jgi:CubicO group peptidase (beta-lactamase class C family)
MRFPSRSLMLAVALATSARAQEPFPGLDAYVTKAVQAWKVPGLSIAIVRNDSVLYAKGFGVLATGGTTPVNDQTLFEIGSSSKAFTATLVSMLVTDGKMRYDDHVSDYLPTLKLADPVANAELTLRDAMTHRSGLDRGELIWMGSGLSRDEVLHRLRFLKPSSPFRSRYSYQNMMFLAAGQSAAKAGGAPWEDLVTQRIFAPLGMSKSLASWHAVGSNANVARPHGQVRDSVFVKPFMNTDNIAPAGAILSSAHDMAQWLRFQMGDGTFGGKRLVSTANLRETHTPQILMGGGGGRGGEAETLTNFSAYGFGWMIQDYRHQLMWQHGGNTEGSTAAVGMLPEQKLGVVVLANMQSAQLPAILMRYIFDRQLGAPMQDLSAEALARVVAQRRRADSVEVAQAGERKSSTSLIPLASYAGTYADSMYGEAAVSVVGDHLELARGLWRGPLEYLNPTNFRWTILPDRPVAGLVIKFELSPTNQVTGLYFGLGTDATLLSRKGTGGGRGGRGGTP